ncbi:MAG: IS21-like element helper ATPase IstB [Sulfuricaulis sp.]|nr:IS21-like element helper ATPase IstB [Sulfuricaulis sp.]
MLNEQTIAILNGMKLFGMAQSLPQRLADPKQAELSHGEFAALLAQDEKMHRDNRRLVRLLKNAKLKQQAAVEDIDYRHPRGLARQAMMELANGEWMTAGRNVLITGPTGVGKSYIACALGNLAARAGHPVLYTRAPRLFEALQQARGDGSHLKVLTRMGKVQVLIIDDFLITPLAAAERKDFLEIIEDRYASTATVITSQCPLKDWHESIGDPTLADAICDRLLHNAYKFELRGESIRKPKKGT